MPFGLNCKVVEASKLMSSPVPDQETGDPTLVKGKVTGQDGGVPDRVWVVSWEVVVLWEKTIW
jgi:hypothetical protein